MAQRPIFMADPTAAGWVRVETVEFQWHAGFSLAQKQRSIQDLHDAGARHCATNGAALRFLEISSKSPDASGVALSAFNLMRRDVGRAAAPLECAFQGSKVFRDGGPYTDLFRAGPLEAKRDPRLRNAGPLQGFHFAGVDWPLTPVTAFYDWLYLTSLAENPALAEACLAYDGFTDIEFNPAKSLNCQARAAALFVALTRGGHTAAEWSDQAGFLALMQNGGRVAQPRQASFDL